MKTLISSAFAAAFLFSGSVFADEPKPVELSAAQMDQVVAGVGFGPKPGAGVKGWIGNGDFPIDPTDNGLMRAGFETPTLIEGIPVEVWPQGRELPY